MNLFRRKRICGGITIVSLVGIVLYLNNYEVITSTRNQSKDNRMPTSYASLRLQQREKLWKDLELSCINKTKQKRFPRIIGAGVEKCGTDAMIQFLKPHPLIRLPQNVETHFFDHSQSDTNINMGIYLDLMPEAEEHSFVMEKSPSYFNFFSFSTPFAIKKNLPDVKILISLCDPVYRVLSDFVHEGVLVKVLANHNTGIQRFNSTESYISKYIPKVEAYFKKYEHATFQTQEKKILELKRKDSLTHILTTGFYALHLRRWLETFKKDEIMIIDAEEMMTDPGTVVEKIQDFVKLPKVLLREDYVKDNETGFYAYKDWKAGNKLKKIPKGKQRTRNGHQHLSEKAIEKLQLFYKSHNEALFKMLNRTFLWS